MSSSGNGFNVIITTPRGSTIKRVEGDVLSVGRAVDCNVQIESAEVGRRHLSVVVTEGLCSVEDNSSTNGTYLNGKKLEPKVATPVGPKDQIHLGKSGIWISVSRDEAVPASSVTKTVNTEITSSQVRFTPTANTASMAIPIPVVPAAATPTHSESTERILIEAHSRAGKIIQAAEMQAERKVQQIYHDAEAAQFKAEQAYQTKMKEAFVEAEKILQKVQDEAKQLMDNARENANEIRAQVETYVTERRQRTDADCERVLGEAQKIARECKETRLQEADAIIAAKQDAILKETREQLFEQSQAYEAELRSEVDQRRAKMELEIKTQQENFAREKEENEKAIERLKRELLKLAEDNEREHQLLAEFEPRVRKEESRLAKLSKQMSEAEEKNAEAKKGLLEVKAEADKLEALRPMLQTQVDELQSKIESLQKTELELSQRMKSVQSSIDSDILKLNEEFEKQKLTLQQEEQERLRDLQFETTRKLKETERELLTEILTKKVRMSHELALVVEGFLKQVPLGDSRFLPHLEERLLKQLDTQITTLNADPKKVQKSIASLRRAERWRSRFSGAVIGALLLWGGNSAYVVFKSEPAPLDRRVAAASEARRQDLEKRKFAPAQTPELRSNYVDDVIYTESFATIYVSDDFQRKFLQALSPYMLKTWRLDEDKTIQLIAASGSLVKELIQKRENIHPDFVNKDIQKMRDLEAESLRRINVILGSQVRFESFKKFERSFYDDYRAQIAAHP